MTAHHIADVVFRAATYRAMHFAPVWLAIVIAIGGAVLLLRGRS